METIQPCSREEPNLQPSDASRQPHTCGARPARSTCAQKPTSRRITEALLLSPPSIACVRPCRSSIGGQLRYASAAAPTTASPPPAHPPRPLLLPAVLRPLLLPAVLLPRAPPSSGRVASGVCSRAASAACPVASSTPNSPDTPVVLGGSACVCAYPCTRVCAWHQQMKEQLLKPFFIQVGRGGKHVRNMQNPSKVCACACVSVWHLSLNSVRPTRPILSKTKAA